MAFGRYQVADVFVQSLRAEPEHLRKGGGAAGEAIEGEGEKVLKTAVVNRIGSRSIVW